MNCCSVTWLCPTLCDYMDCRMPVSLSFTISWSLLKQVHWVSDTVQSSCPLSPHLFFLTSVFPRIRVFPNELVLHIRWPKYWSFSFSISPFNEYSGLISFRIDWFDLLAVQGILKSLYQHHRSKESILWGSAFFGNFPHDSDSKRSACNVEDLGSVPGLGSFPGEGSGNILQFSCLDNSMDIGTCWTIVHGIAKLDTTDD